MSINENETAMVRMVSTSIPRRLSFTWESRFHPEAVRSGTPIAGVPMSVKCWSESKTETGLESEE